MPVTQAAAQPQDAAALQWQRVELGAAGSRYPFAIYSNKPWQGDMARVRTAMLVFHGMGRNGDAYYTAAEKLLYASGKADETLLLAPNFFNPSDAKRHPVAGLPLWQGSRWNYGADAMNWPRALSSFQPIDDVLAVLADRARFPLLESVVLAGHSGGGDGLAVVVNEDGGVASLHDQFVLPVAYRADDAAALRGLFMPLDRSGRQCGNADDDGGQGGSCVHDCSPLDGR